MSRKKRIIVAMSGGVDSSVAAALVARAGHEAVGVTMQLYSGAPSRPNSSARKGACCAGQDIADAARVAAALGIPHYVLDYEARFRDKVIADFADSYGRGETPVPCIRCNERVKFTDLLQAARDMGGDALATGHYVRRIEGAGGPELHAAGEAARDQSYFLFTTTPAQLDFLRFPVGELPKPQVRAIAAELGLVTADKPDSQDICFVPSGRYTNVIDRLRPGAARPGEIVDRNGAVLGRHDGITHFTVGQRKGLGLSGNEEPLFVLKLDAATARVVVGPRAALAAHAVTLREVNWLAPASGAFECAVKVRSMRPAVPARVIPLEGGAARVELHVPEEAVAPGQACVFYDGSRVLGGGWIAAGAEAAAA